MLRRLLIAALPAAVLAVAVPARAGEAEAKKQVADYVELKPVGMPVIVGGRLLNYVFASIRLNLAPGVDAERWREREPLFRDALVRAGYRTPFVLPNDTSKLDVARLSAAMLREAAAIAGPGVVSSITVTSQVATRRAQP